MRSWRRRKGFLSPDPVIGERPESILEKGGKIRIARVDDLTDVEDELGNVGGGVAGAHVDEVFDDAIDPRRRGVLHA